jgi:hypothetical protein
VKPAATRPLLAELQLLLARHGEAVRAGDAEAVALLAEQVRQHVAVLGRGPAPLGAGDAQALQALLRQCVQTQAGLARRQAGVARSLQALTAAAPQTELSQRTYSAQGTLAGTGLRSGFVRA